MPFLIIKHNSSELVINTDQIASISENVLRPAGTPVGYTLHLTSGFSPVDLNPQDYAELKSLLKAEYFPSNRAAEILRRNGDIK